MTDNLNKPKIEKVSCPFCGSVKAIQFRNKADIVKCLSCSTVYLRTIEDRQATIRIYQKYHDEDSHLAPPLSIEKVKTSPLRREQFMSELLEFAEAKGKMLDIGCGWGAFIDNAREKGFETFGIEVAQKGVDYAVNKLQLQVVRKDFLELSIPDNYFSVISIIHTLEHLENPKQVLEKALRVLKPGGLLCGIVPNIDSYASTMLTDSWEWIDPNFHIVHFSPSTLKKHLENAGFEIKRIYTKTGDFSKQTLYELIARVSNIYDKELQDIEINKIENNNLGEEIRFFVVKPGSLPVEDFNNNINDKKMKNPVEVSYNDNEVIVELQEDSDYEEILYNHFTNLKEYRKLILVDKFGILPENSKDWNGVEVIKEYEKPQFVPVEDTQPVKEELKEEIQIENEEDVTQQIENTGLSFLTINRLLFKEDLKGGLSNKLAIGKLPSQLPEPLQLNLGCGNDFKDGFINIDMFSDNPNVVDMDIRKLQFADDSVDLIIANDVINHFSHREVDYILKEWARVLKPNSKLYIKCPSLQMQAKAYLDGEWDCDIASYMIFGGQTNPGDYHCVGFDENSIRKHLTLAGFVVDKIEPQDDAQELGYVNLNMIIEAHKIEKLPTYENKIFTDSNNNRDKKLGEKLKNGFIQDDQLDIFGVDEVIVDKKEIPELNIVWEGSQFVYHSLALINREQCSNIIDSGLLELTIVPYEPEQFVPDGNEKYEKLIKKDIRFKNDTDEEVKKQPYLWVRHQWPPKKEAPLGAKWVIMQPWEYSTLPKEFADLFNQADEIWTPSNYSRQCMINSGVEFNKVQVIPNGIDPEKVLPKGDKYNLSTNKKFKLLYVGGTIFRKGIDLLLTAYASSFNSQDDICLVIKDMGGDSFYKGQTAEQHIELLKSKPNAPEVIYIDEYLSEEEMINLYRACDVLVSPYRGEGFSMPTLEAMACGLPVIVTQGGSTDDFVDEQFAWLIPSTKRSIGNMIGDKFLTGEAFVLEPDIIVLQDTLKFIYNNPTSLTSMGMIGQYKARTLWTWKKSTIKIFSRIDKLYGKSLAIKAEKALVDKQDGNILVGKAESLFYQGDFNDAELNYELAIKSGDLSEKYLMHAIHRLALIYIGKGNLTDARDLLNKAQVFSKNQPDNLYLQSLAFSRQKMHTEALEILTNLFDNWKDMKYHCTLGLNLDDLLCDTGEIFLEFQDTEGALKLFTDALKVNNLSYRACTGGAKCFISVGAYDEARNMLDWALKSKPDFKEALELYKELE